jgi:hypothetical protein
MDEITRVLRKLKDLAPDALQEAHDEMIDGFDEQGRPMAEGHATFELDEKMHKVPFQKLRDVLQGKDPSSVVTSKEVFRGRIPKLSETGMLETALRGASAASEDNFNEDSPDGDYYWDKNYNYEYMHPDAEKQRVLGKVRK